MHPTAPTGAPVQTAPTVQAAPTGSEQPGRRCTEVAGLGAFVAARLRLLERELTVAGLGAGLAVHDEPRLAPAGPGEADAVASMPWQRRLEFLAGRLAARRALGAVGLDCGEIPRAGRLPVFPPGRAASISHSSGVAVAVARAPGRDTPLGCDLELRPLPAAAARLVLREDEEELLRGTGPKAVPWSVTSLFSAKEAAWKALHGSGAADGLSGLRDLRAARHPNGLRVEARSAAAPALRVRVIEAGPGFFSTVLGWADG
ncbi:4'-phosphopantetheinyl transferase family protein [Streptomyces yokosukanensis]|uniref:4'-phosphopantetheinyl transferase family protein n=1 Tax=Streptomyces yokosukanensis TaxID=67386 RepID=UPI00099EAE0F|nr:4'-phosphopantetheinyl transferase superfamily protein [Streptomyces yokosukanensis]